MTHGNHVSRKGTVLVDSILPLPRYIFGWMFQQCASVANQLNGELIRPSLEMVIDILNGCLILKTTAITILCDIDHHSKTKLRKTVYRSSSSPSHLHIRFANTHTHIHILSSLLSFIFSILSNSLLCITSSLAPPPPSSPQLPSTTTIPAIPAIPASIFPSFSVPPRSLPFQPRLIHFILFFPSHSCVTQFCL